MNREVVTICCPECVGAGPVEDWSHLDPHCGLCTGCGRIDIDQPAQPLPPSATRRSLADPGRGAG